MKSWKSIMVLVGVLIIGFGIGFYTNRALHVKRLKQIAQWRTSQGMTERLMGVLEATEEQRTTLVPIVETYTEKLMTLNKELGTQMREKRKPVLYSMRLELNEYLTTDQQETLDNYMERLARNRFGPWRNRKNKGESQKVKDNT
jgi:hypothetical protein